jgi:hypothetical protein
MVVTSASIPTPAHTPAVRRFTLVGLPFEVIGHTARPRSFVGEAA